MDKMDRLRLDISKLAIDLKKISCVDPQLWAKSILYTELVKMQKTKDNE